jgi:hypothetical protein
MHSETDAKVVIYDKRISKMIEFEALPTELWTTPIIDADFHFGVHEQKPC